MRQYLLLGAVSILFSGCTAFFPLKQLDPTPVITLRATPLKTWVELYAVDEDKASLALQRAIDLHVPPQESPLAVIDANTLHLQLGDTLAAYSLVSLEATRAGQALTSPYSCENAPEQGDKITRVYQGVDSSADKKLEVTMYVLEHARYQENNNVLVKSKSISVKNCETLIQARTYYSGTLVQKERGAEVAKISILGVETQD